MPEALLYDSHIHTELCRHATGRLEEYAQVAIKKGFKGIIFADHNPLAAEYGQDWRMQEDELETYIAMVAACREAFAGRLDVRLGLECDYYPGAESYIKQQLTLADWNYVLGSVHCGFQEYQEQYHCTDVLSLYRTYFDHEATAAETRLYDALAHFDFVKNLFFDQWQLAAVMDDVRRSLDRIAATGTAMELNTSGLLKCSGEFSPSRDILVEMHRRAIPVVLGSDAHSPDRVGADFRDALLLLQEIGYDSVTYFLQRKRQEISISNALASIERCQKLR